ncbi:hypothetical protein RintRC_2207 [Richelia intracellularis]|nr:hypothetical protein RintRC_2207 [Richelia intracellularis]
MFSPIRANLVKGSEVANNANCLSRGVPMLVMTHTAILASGVVY